MQVIPVIDVRGGVVVRAAGGDRAKYAPIETPLAEGCDPVQVALGFSKLFPFAALYMADLDGIAGDGRNLDVVKRLSEALPDVALWIDDGSCDVASAEPLLAIPGTLAVVGSETLKDLATLANLRSRFGERIALSLDFKAGEFLGDPALLADETHWPDRVIVMSLAYVGSDAGPDLATIAGIEARAGARKVYAAGGVRNAADLVTAWKAGAAGALVATALHAGKIKAGDLKEIAGL